MTIIAKSKINNTTVKLVQLKNCFKVSYCGFKREFSTIEKAAEHYSSTVKSFVDNDSRNLVSDYNRFNSIQEQLKDL
ncbi:hypothetical protein DIDNDMLP_00236 [Klebsiella phage KP13-7]|nr:hypothetical protein DIDNDMLP_00236 [Klebsiella phage KP13-7]